MLEAIEKALEELGTSKGKRWNIGMPLPPGRAPRLNYGRKGRSDGGYSSSARNYGKDWVGDFPRDEDQWDDIPRGRAIERIVNEVLDKTGLRFVWIIFANHSEKYCYDKDGNRVQVLVNGKRKWKTEKADSHITVRLGMDENTCMLHGHINVTVDENNIPTGLMEKGTRKHMIDGDDRVLELWEYTKKPNAIQPWTMSPRQYDQGRNTVVKHKHVPVARLGQDSYRPLYPLQGYTGQSRQYKPRSYHAKSRYPNDHRKGHCGNKKTIEGRYPKGKLS